MDKRRAIIVGGRAFGNAGLRPVMANSRFLHFASLALRLRSE